MSGELRAGEREVRRPEPNTVEAACALRDELNRGERPRAFTRWVTGGMPPNMIVYRERRWMPEDVEEQAADVEAHYLAEMRELLPAVEPEAIIWRSIELRGEAPDTCFEAVFSPTRAAEHLYGWRWRIWPLDAPQLSFDYDDISYQEYFADGIGADARFGRIPVEPGEIRWLTPEV